MSKQKKADPETNLGIDTFSLEKIADISLNFLEFPLGDNIYEFIAEKFTELASVKAVTVSEYISETDSLRCRAVNGTRDIVTTGLKLFNNDLIGKEFKISCPETRDLIMSGKPTFLDDGFYRVTFGIIPRIVCDKLEKLTGISRLCAIGLARADTLLGSMVFVPGDEGLDTNLINAFSRQASGVLHRLHIEKQRALLEHQLNHSQKMESIGRLAGGIAHDFNNLLTVINGNASMIIDDIPEGDPVHIALQEILAASNRAASLTRQLLAFSRRGLMQPSRFSINDLLRQFSAMITRMIGEDIKLVLDLQADKAAFINADHSQVEQICLNLVINARDAMPGGGTLTILTRDYLLKPDIDSSQPELEAGLYLSISVKDTGKGIDEIDLTNIFEPFFTTKPKDKGTGLGLSTVFGIVKQHNGRIQAESRLGAGAAFNILFPVGKSPAATGESKTKQTADNKARVNILSPGERPENILLAEDEPTVRTATANVLRRSGYHVLEAESGPRAIEISRNFDGRIHLLMTDVIMPGMNGRELADKFTRDRPETAVLYASGYTEDIIGDKGVLDNDLHFIAKPFTIRELVTKVRKVLDYSCDRPAATAEREPGEKAIPDNGNYSEKPN